jgi:lipopolysaccharide/colanic/teichoic acid biosynthesis glycosyltransferase
VLTYAASDKLLWSVVADGLSNGLHLGTTNKVACAIPEEWPEGTAQQRALTLHYGQRIPIGEHVTGRSGTCGWLIVSNGRFATYIAADLLEQLLQKTRADVLAVNADPQLLAPNERLRLTNDGRIAGFCRLYTDSFEPAPIPRDWPHHLVIRKGAVAKILDEGSLPVTFAEVLDKCRSNALIVRAAKIGGIALDLETEQGLLDLCTWQISGTPRTKLNVNSYWFPSDNGVTVRNARIVGKVLIGQNVRIDPDAVIAGPAMICDGARIEQGAVIDKSLIGPGVHVHRGGFIQNRFIMEQVTDVTVQTGQAPSAASYRYSLPHKTKEQAWSVYRTWPRFSYARTVKRIIDIIIAATVLVLFAPVAAFIALAIKISSPGPVLFKDKRQGLSGRQFCCLKFRTMRVGADRIQEKLRAASEVDGPQFKIQDDPRITTVGHFLRATYIDEIPQFINVFLGQMSVVGPRPSPESENTMCPYWRDARLSVRPGITGLWQVCRTRKAMLDFQEWIHYDLEYVKNLAPRLDLWICWQTVKKLVNDFINQF